MDETGIEPVTFCLQGKRATNYATRPRFEYWGALKILELQKQKADLLISPL